MLRQTRWTGIAMLSLLLGCGSGGSPGALPGGDPGANPFLASEEPSKQDTGYTNLRGVEVEVTLEADVEGADWRIFDAPADLAQYAVTYLRNETDIYLEILAEDATAPDRVEWLVDGNWLGRAEAEAVDRAKLRRFRLLRANAVLMERSGRGVEQGKVFEAIVPVKPYSVMADAGNTCGQVGGHIELSQSTYWYLWDPSKRGCKAVTQKMTLTVTKVMPRNPESYPEYDRLWEDGRLDVAIFFAKLDDGDVAVDQNWGNLKTMAKWLTDAGFAEEPNAPMGRRFSKRVGERLELVDLYGPDLFHNVADYSHLANWQKAVTDHEVIMYNGHSVLGTGMAFERVRYPEHYQIFQVASCLSYEYYVRPVLAGKGGWENVDVVSNVEPTYYHENLPLTSSVLARLFYGFENGGRASWQDIMEAVSRRLGHARFGVSGARGNCFSPEGDRCATPPPPPAGEKRFESTTTVAIPDDDPAGAVSTIEIPDSLPIGQLKVELDVTHTWVGDLMVVLEHDDVAYGLWENQGSSDDDIRITMPIPAFTGVEAKGTWRLRIVDGAAADVGTLNRWALLVTPAQ